MTEIHELLERSVDQPAHLDVAADLRRGRRALHRRRTRIAAGVTGGVAALGVVGVTTLPRLSDHVHAVPSSSQPDNGPVRTPYFEVPQPPAGWTVEASPARTAFLVLRPDGARSQGPGPDIDHWDGKVVLMLHEPGESFGFGSTIRYGGRTFYDNERNAGSPILAVRETDGRWLQLQYPTSAGFGTRQMVEYLDGVVVLPGAKGFGN